MTPARLAECLAALRWTKVALADAAALDERQVRRWATGQAAIPPAIAAWLERAVAWHEKNPIPPRR
jgi:hypothetical protein